MSMKTNAGFPSNILSKIYKLISDLRAHVDEEDEDIRSSITNVQNSVTSVANRVTTLENNANGTHIVNAYSVFNNIGTKDYEDTIKKNKQVFSFVNVKGTNIPGGGRTRIGTIPNSAYRPSSNIKRKCWCGSSTGGGNSWFSDIYFQVDGQVIVDNQTNFAIEEYNFEVSFVTSN